MRSRRSFLVSRTGKHAARFLTGVDLTQRKQTDQIEALLIEEVRKDEI